MLLRFPFTDLQGAKQRPALVVSADAYNDRSEDVIVAAITSARVDNPGPFDHPLGDWKGSGLLHPSLVRGGKVATLHRSMIRRTLGAIPARDLAEIEGKLKQALDLG